MAQYTLKKVFNYIKFKDILSFFICVIVFPFAIISKIFIRNLWLVCEDEFEARDNGYWFFKWVKENRPKQKIVYAINKKSVDYNKVKVLGKVIKYGGVSHWFYYIVADKNISSQKGGKPNPAVCYFFEVVLGLRKNNRVFLQHGITINKGDWLFYKNTKFKLFITAIKQEHDFIKQEFGYPENNVKLLGFSRFDNLHNLQVDKDLILLMPSWREWLGREGKDNKNLDFKDSEYFKKWSEFLNSNKLLTLLEKYDKKLIFYPHRNMQKFLKHFTFESDRIIFANSSSYDVQDLLKTASVLITDYSSVFFDFAYMKKPVLFYQFDECEFRQKQYKKGYLDYHNTPLGYWTDNLEGLIDNLQGVLTQKLKASTESEFKDIFTLWDDENSRRIYESIQKL